MFHAGNRDERWQRSILLGGHCLRVRPRTPVRPPPESPPPALCPLLALAHLPPSSRVFVQRATSAFVDSKEPAAGAAVLVEFSVPSTHLEFGQHLRVVGSSPELGLWDPQGALTLEWSEGDNWTGRIALVAACVLEWKLVRVSHGRADWEGDENRCLTVPGAAATAAGGTAATLHVHAAFGDTRSTAVEVVQPAVPFPAQPARGIDLPAAFMRGGVEAAPAAHGGESRPAVAEPVWSEEGSEPGTEETGRQQQQKEAAPRPAAAGEQPPPMQQRQQPEHEVVLAAAGGSPALEAAAQGTTELRRIRIRQPGRSSSASPSGGGTSSARSCGSGSGGSAGNVQSGRRHRGQFLSLSVLTAVHEDDGSSDESAWEALQHLRRAQQAGFAMPSPSKPLGSNADALSVAMAVPEVRDDGSLVFHFADPPSSCSLTAGELAQQRLLPTLPAPASAALKVRLHGRPPKPASDGKSTGSHSSGSSSSSSLSRAMDFAALRGGGPQPELPEVEEGRARPGPHLTAGPAGQEGSNKLAGVPAPKTVEEVTLAASAAAPGPASQGLPAAAVPGSEARTGKSSASSSGAGRPGSRAELPGVAIWLLAQQLTSLGSMLWAVLSSPVPEPGKRPASVAFWLLYFGLCCLPLL